MEEVTQYLFERRKKSKVIYQKDIIRRSNFILRRLWDFIGKYEKIDAGDINDTKLDYNCIEYEDLKSTFVARLKEFGQNGFITSNDIIQLISTMKINIDVTVYLMYLWRMSIFFTKLKEKL